MAVLIAPERNHAYAAPNGNYTSDSYGYVNVTDVTDLAYFQALWNDTPDTARELAGGALARALRTALPIGTRGQVYRQGESDGVITSATYRTKHLATAVQGVGGIRLVYGNFQNETAGSNTITVKAGLEYPAGTFYPAFFNGARSVSIESGGVAISDPIAVDLPAGAAFFVRSCPSASSGGKWPLGLTTYPVDGEGNDSNSDKTVSGTVTTAFAFAYSPLAILGGGQNAGRSVLMVGDSIITGQGDDVNDRGFAVIGLSDRYGVVKISKPGETAQTFAGNANRFRRMMLATLGTTEAIVNYGVNDVTAGRTLAQIQSDLTTIWSTLQQYGMRVYQTTITPVTTSTDNWATLANQTVNANDSVRQSVNAWLRARPAPLAGVFDVAALAESGTSGKWIANGSANYATGDGTHPSTAMHAIMAGAMPAQVFG